MSKRGENIYKRKDGRWEGRYIKSRGQDGQVKYGYVYASNYKTVRNKLIEKKYLYNVNRNPSQVYSGTVEPRSKSLKADDKMFNKIISKIRVRIEHVFGFVENSMHGSSLRSIGFDRAVLNTDLTNLTYNLLRYEQVKRLNLKTWR